MTARNRAAFVVGFLAGMGIVISLSGCTEPTAPPPLVTCHAQVIDTPQGPWTVGQSCDATDPRTGQGHAVKP